METIDLYDKNKNKLNKTFIRKKDTLLENEYYLLEQAWIVNDEGKILLTQRGLNKSHGGMWEATAGHVKARETDMEGILREIKEETNLDCNSFTLLNVFSGKDFYFKYPNGDELYSVVALYLANDVAGELKITDGESFKLEYFSKNDLPNLESRAKVILDWLIEKEYLK